jgi:predicted enzyme related to lactoylglutathione lyase
MTKAPITTQIKANLQLIYVSDIERSTNFYKEIFKSDPVFSSPRYVAFSAGAEALFAIWTGGETPDAEAPRFSEIGIMLPTGEDVDHLFKEWSTHTKINILKEPYDTVFGRTFMIKDPDGHVIRVSPLD